MGRKFLPAPLLLQDGSAAQDGVAVVYNSGLPGGDGPLRLGETDVNPVPALRRDQGLLLRLPVADFHPAGEGTLGRLAGNPVEAGHIRLRFQQLFPAAQGHGVVFGRQGADIQRLARADAQASSLVMLLRSLPWTVFQPAVQE